MRSVEGMCEGIDISKWRTLSDKGAGVERMIDTVDAEGNQMNKGKRIVST